MDGRKAGTVASYPLTWVFAPEGQASGWLLVTCILVPDTNLVVWGGNVFSRPLLFPRVLTDLATCSNLLECSEAAEKLCRSICIF